MGTEQHYAMLLVDDEETFRHRLAQALTRRGFTVREACDVEAALVILRDWRPDLALIDLRMPGRSGLELVAEIKRLQPTVRIVVLTGYGSIATASQAIKLGAMNYLPKPADVDEILQAFSEDGGPPMPIGPEEFVPPSLARVEWEHIQRVLTDCDGNISEAARKLNIHRRSLQRKLFKFPPP